jgi:hypothetical protein
MTDYYITMREAGAPKSDFRLGGGPIDEHQSHQELFAAVGLLATSWARFEYHLDAILVHVNSSLHSGAIYNPEHPVSFGAKIKLLKRWFNQHPGLADLAQPMRDLTSRAKELSKIRHSILHFVLEDWDQNGQLAKFHGLKWLGNDEFEAQTVTVTIEALRSFADIVNAGNKWLEQISRSLFTDARLAQLRKP